MRVKIISIFVVLIVVSCGDEIRESTQYYDSGEVKAISSTKDGELDGVYKYYYKNGKIENIGTFENGLKQGKSESFYESGVKSHEAFFRDDTIFSQKDFREDGTLKAISYFENDKLADYLLYLKEGVRDYDRSTIIPVFNSRRDTVSLGEIYEARIRLANRMFDKTEVVLVVDTTKTVITLPRLDKFDSITSIYRHKTLKVGVNSISGTVLNIELDSLGKEVRWLLYPFEHSFRTTDPRELS